ncbi:MAG: carboxymuconolactone decarboxylase family protein [Janthinobacterium lividum]
MTVSVAPSDADDRQTRGKAILREIIGDEYYAKRESAISDFNAEFQQLSEEYCFAEIWGRPGLPRKVRSMLCMAMLVALNRPAQLRLHVAGALRNGCTREEIKELLLQSVIYCGLPAAVDGFRIAEEVLKEHDRA